MGEFERLKARKDAILAEQQIRPYTEATKLAMKLGQTVGPGNEYYVTLRQLEEICKGEKQS